MGQWPWYVGIESTFLKYHDNILQVVSQLSAHLVEGKHKLLETNPESDVIINFYPMFCVF